MCCITGYFCDHDIPANSAKKSDSWSAQIEFANIYAYLRVPGVMLRHMYMHVYMCVPVTVFLVGMQKFNSQLKLLSRFSNCSNNRLYGV